MRKIGIGIICGVAVLAIISGIVICIKRTNNKELKKLKDNSRINAKENAQKTIDQVNDINKEVEIVNANKSVISAEMNERHKEAANYIRELSESIISEEKHEEIITSSVHDELKDMINNL